MTEGRGSTASTCGLLADLKESWGRKNTHTHTHKSPLQSPELRSSGEEPQLFRCPVVSTVSDPPLQPLAILVEWLPLTVHKGWLPHISGHYSIVDRVGLPTLTVPSNIQLQLWNR